MAGKPNDLYCTESIDWYYYKYVDSSYLLTNMKCVYKAKSTHCTIYSC